MAPFRGLPHTTSYVVVLKQATVVPYFTDQILAGVGTAR
jgi:hypothetical protein